MKRKNIYAISSMLCLSASLCAGASIEPKGINGSSGQLSGDKTDDLVLLLPAGGYGVESRFESVGSTVKSITIDPATPSNATPFYFVLSNTTVDIATDASETPVTAIDFSGQTFKLTYTTLNVTNSGGDATALVKIGTFNLFSVSSGSQTQTFNLQKGNIALEIDDAEIGSDIYNADSRGNFNINATANVTFKGLMNVNKTGRFTNNGSFVADGASTHIYMKNGSVNKVAGTFGLNNSASLTVESGATLSLGANREVFKVANKSGKGTIINNGEITSTSDCLNIYDNFTNNGSLTAKTGLYLYNGITFKTADGSTNILSVTTSAPKVIIADGSTLDMSESIVGSNGYYIDIANITGSTATIKVNGDVTIGRINQGNSGNGLIHILLSDTGVLRFDHVENNVISLYRGMNIYNFREGSIFLGTNLSESILEDIAKIKLYEGDVDSTEFVVAKITADGWLTAVPEPAEWAAIFGAVALAFAAYRRRK